MRFGKKFELAWNTLVHSKLRSWLTIIGIIIGIAAVVAIVSISKGAQESLSESLNSFGADQVTVTPGFSQASGSFSRRSDVATTVASDEDDPELTDRDIISIQSVDNVKLVSPKVFATEEVVYSTKHADVSISAIEYEYWDTMVSSEIEEGRALTSSDVYAAVVGGSVSENTFGGMQINRQITINDRTFRIVGILDIESRSIFIPLDSAVGVLDEKEEGVYDSLIVVTENAELVENTTSDVIARLMMSRGILKESERDFTVSNMLSMQQAITATLETLALFLGAIAAISLLVGGIGIANTMFTSVLEKTKEIGIMKAIGATNGDIMIIFLLNSALIGLVGGLGGILLGSSAGLFVGGGSGESTSRVMSTLFSSTVITWELLAFALGFSIVIGMIAGAIPAYRASRLKPVDALRYE